LYLVIWGWLAGLMLVGVLVSERPILPLAKAGLVALVLALSTVKAALVAMYYMHLKMDRRLLLLVVFTPFVLIALALGVVFSSTLIRL
jgi:cytochrome c oxidase subunit 4